MGNGVDIRFDDITQLTVYPPYIDALRHLLVLLGGIRSVGVKAVTLLVYACKVSVRIGTCQRLCGERFPSYYEETGNQKSLPYLDFQDTECELDELKSNSADEDVYSQIARITEPHDDSNDDQENEGNIQELPHEEKVPPVVLERVVIPMLETLPQLVVRIVFFSVHDIFW